MFAPAARLFWLAGWVALLGVRANLFAADTNQITASRGKTAADFDARARQEFSAARRRFQAQTNNAEAAWQLGRACFDLAALATNNTERAELAEQGIAVCRQLIAREPDSAPAHYYLGMNLGQLADTKRNLGALRIVKEMEREFGAAGQLDEHFDFAGPDRNLGLLYREAPSFISIGSRSKARQHLQRAVELAPDYPENRLNLIEADLKWGDRSGARRELKTLEELWPETRKKFNGDTWTANWADWEQRFKSAKKKIEAPPKTLEPPRHEN